jgi:hypothetical protein
VSALRWTAIALGAATLVGAAIHFGLDEPRGGTPLRPSCPDPGAGDYYFPRELFASERDTGDYLLHRYLPSLRRAGAISLSCGSPPQAIRLVVSKRGEPARVTTIEDPRKLGEAEKALREAGFWQLQSRPEPSSASERFLLEAQLGGRYHAVERPAEPGRLAKACEFLTAL